jgi:cobalt-zinc-cadmium efflux system membrane fusion protein
MKRFRIPAGIILAVLLTGLLLTGCKNKNQTGREDGALNLPPSLTTGSDPGKVLVKLSPQEVKELNIPLLMVKSETRTYTLTAPGTVYPAQNHIGIISAPVDGRVLDLPVHEGQRVTKGQVVTELESLTFGTLVADYLQAIAEVDLQSNQLDRMTKLTEKRISAEADLERVKADHTRAMAGVNAAYARLKTVGVSDAEIDALRSTARINPRLKVHSPINGVVDSHRVELGQAVAANDVLATVISLDQVLIRAYLAPEDGMLVNPGDTVRISHRLINEKPLEAVVSTINPGLDENNRSMVVNILVNQRDGLLKPGDNVRTEIATRSPAEIITVTMDAITYDNDDPVVFVRLDDHTYEMRPVAIREIANGFAVVTSGLASGEQVAAGQVFSLKALSRFKQISEE